MDDSSKITICDLNQPDNKFELNHIANRIYIVRGHKVMLDSDLAQLYGVPTFRLNEQVRRNLHRFPEDFMFQLTNKEALALRSQFAILKPSRRGEHRKYLPYVFTEQGVAMLSSVLHSEQAIRINIAIMRAFVKLRDVLSTHKDLVNRLNVIDRRLASHDGRLEEYSAEIRAVFQAIRQLMTPRKRKSRIGFRA